MVLAAIVATRWFDARRGLVLGALSAANATGQLVFLPLLAQRGRAARLARRRARSSPAPRWSCSRIVLVFMRDRPEDLGLRRYGQAPGSARARRAARSRRWRRCAMAVRSPAFWVLAGTFFVCGASTNGLIGTHLIAACHDYGISEVRSAQLLAVMGIFDIVGTTASGWLTDRYSSRHLLFGYYTLRGLSLLYPAVHAGSRARTGSGWFAVFYGLDWIATVPPTVRLTGEAFGRENTGVIYGWIGASHQLGASLAAFGAGAIRTVAGDYEGVLDRRRAVRPGRHGVPDDRAPIVPRRHGHGERSPPLRRKSWTQTRRREPPEHSHSQPRPRHSPDLTGAC